MSQLLVGAGKACITPTPNLFPFLQYGVQRAAVHDDIFVRVVLIDNGVTRAAIVSFDLCILPPPEKTRAIISEAGGVQEENIFMCATHNHSVPYTKRDNPGLAGKLTADSSTEGFTKICLEGAQKAVEMARKTLRPGKCGYGTGESYINVNRDKLFEDGYWMQGGNFAGYSDKTLAAVKFVDSEERLIAAVLNYSAHAVLGFMYPDFDGKLKVSGDYVGYACRYAEKRFGNDAVVLWTPGAEGNQNPYMSASVFRYEDDGYAVRQELPAGTAYMLMQHIGGEHAIDAIRTINRISEYASEISIESASTTVKLPAQKPPEGADMQYNRMIVDNRIPLNPDGSRPEKKLVTMEDDPEHPYAMPMQLLKLGDIAFVGLPNEIYAEIGRDMKNASPMKNTIVVTHTDSRYIGYIADKASAHHKVFQSFGPVKPGVCDEIIIGGMLDLFGKHS